MQLKLTKTQTKKGVVDIYFSLGKFKSTDMYLVPKSILLKGKTDFIKQHLLIKAYKVRNIFDMTYKCFALTKFVF